MSTTFRWRLTLAALAAVFSGGCILTALLALGLADPPRTGTLQWQADTPPQAPVNLPAAYTLELTARNDGPPESAWGIRLARVEETLAILIDNQGYLSISSDDKLHWAEFPHIRPFDKNQLYLHVEPDSTATLRINHEIAWEGAVKASAWETVEHQQSALDWQTIALYYE